MSDAPRTLTADWLSLAMLPKRPPIEDARVITFGTESV